MIMNSCCGFSNVPPGCTPYPTIATKDLLASISAGHRMEEPGDCPPNL